MSNTNKNGNFSSVICILAIDIIVNKVFLVLFLTWAEVVVCRSVAKLHKSKRTVNKLSPGPIRCFAVKVWRLTRSDVFEWKVEMTTTFILLINWNRRQNNEPKLAHRC